MSEIKEFDPIKYDKGGKEAEKVIWSTKSLNAAVKALNEGLPLKANPFIGKNTKLLKPDLVYRRTPEEIEDYVILKGKLDENVYFDIEINLDYLSFKLDERKFNNIKAEILGKISGSNVEYGIDNPIYVRYNLTDINEFEIVEVD